MNILIIEDYKSVAHILASILSANDYNCASITSSDVNDNVLKSPRFRVYILNLKLKRKSSLELVLRLKNLNPFAYIIGVSTKSSWKEKVEFLNHGGDDVLDYPFPMQELPARIRALQRRPKGDRSDVLRVRDFEIDTNTKEVAKGRRGINLRRREYTLLEYLVRNKGRIVGREELLEQVWDYRRITGSNTVDVHVKRLRDKLDDKSLIETVHGFGYIVKDKNL